MWSASARIHVTQSWRDCSAVKRTYYSNREPGFSSQQPHQKAPILSKIFPQHLPGMRRSIEKTLSTTAQALSMPLLIWTVLKQFSPGKQVEPWIYNLSCTGTWPRPLSKPWGPGLSLCLLCFPVGTKRALPGVLYNCFLTGRSGQLRGSDRPELQHSGSRSGPAPVQAVFLPSTHFYQEEA